MFTVFLAGGIFIWRNILLGRDIRHDDVYEELAQTTHCNTKKKNTPTVPRLQYHPHTILHRPEYILFLSVPVAGGRCRLPVASAGQKCIL
jgi:hypothetical protein